MYLINHSKNTACVLHKSGTHRIYFNRKRKGTKQYIYKNKYNLALNRLLYFGYIECTEVVFNAWFE
jgi:hypothetical protein